MRVGTDFGVGRRFLALVAAVCTLGSLAVTPLANAADNEPVSSSATVSEQKPTAAATGKVQDQDGKQYDTIADAIKAGAKTVTLVDDLVEKIVVEKGTTVTLDLNGHVLKPAEQDDANAGTPIINKGTLTVKDSSKGGKGMVIGMGWYVVSNYVGGVLTIDSGNYVRRGAKYAVKNFGTMTINGGVVTSEPTKLNNYNTVDWASTIANGWQTEQDGGTDNPYGHSNPVLNIHGGEVIGGIVAVKNDNYGIFNMDGGTLIQNQWQSKDPWSNELNGGQNGVIGNKNVANITGGRLIGFVFNYAFSDKAQYTKGKPTLNLGGTVEVSPTTDSTQYVFNRNKNTVVNISGGTYTSAHVSSDGKSFDLISDPQNLDDTSYKDSLVLSGGTFNTKVPGLYDLKDGYGIEKLLPDEGSLAKGGFAVVPLGSADITGSIGIDKRGVFHAGDTFTFEVKGDIQLPDIQKDGLIVKNGKATLVLDKDSEVTTDYKTAFSIPLDSQHSDGMYVFAVTAKTAPKGLSIVKGTAMVTVTVQGGKAYPVYVDANGQPTDGLLFTYQSTEVTPKSFTVSFDSRGGSAVASQTVKDGEKAMEPKTPTRAGYTFTGWTSDPEGANDYDFDSPVTEDFTLYAQWQKDSSGGNGGSGNGGNNGGSGNNGNNNGGTTTPSATIVDVERFYNPRSGEHFYTAGAVEQSVLRASGAWRDEGVAFRMSSDKGTPVYRLYNPGAKHLFTTSVKERDVLVKAGWRFEGVAFYVPDGAKTDVHRLYNPGNGDHLLTTSANERGVLVMHKWRDEGIAFKAQ